MRLMREVRCFLTGAPVADRPANPWAGAPATGGLAPFVTIRAVVDGPIDPQRGFVCDIRRIDAMLRSVVVPYLCGRTASGPEVGVDTIGGTQPAGAVDTARAPYSTRVTRVAGAAETTGRSHASGEDGTGCGTDAGAPPTTDASVGPRGPTRAGRPGTVSAAWAIRAAFAPARRCVPPPASLSELVLRVSPFTRYSVRSGDATMVSLTHSFEFSASHRLYCNDLSEEENRRVFGQCTNPHGHGHNYVLDVTVTGPVDRATGLVLDLGLLERTVKARVIDRFDHKHLNHDCPEFATLN
ncbi:MAG: 6-carboxytetrahydropterin synthase, partial [Phycisphaerae bacterium]